jgi:hypothetical protein
MTNMNLKTKIIYPLIPIVAFQFLSCSTFRFCCNSENRRLDDIREAVFRYQFQNSDPTKWQNMEVYFLELMPDKKSPSPEFINRFSDIYPPVKPVSDAVINPRNGVVTDKETGKEGIIFNIEAIRWVDKDSVEVDGSFYVANLCAEGHTYYLKWFKGIWVVYKDIMHWIS